MLDRLVEPPDGHQHDAGVAVRGVRCRRSARALAARSRARRRDRRAAAGCCRARSRRRGRRSNRGRCSAAATRRRCAAGRDDAGSRRARRDSDRTRARSSPRGASRPRLRRTPRGPCTPDRGCATPATSRGAISTSSHEDLLRRRAAACRAATRWRSCSRTRTSRPTAGRRVFSMRSNSSSASSTSLRSESIAPSNCTAWTLSGSDASTLRNAASAPARSPVRWARVPVASSSSAGTGCARGSTTRVVTRATPPSSSACASRSTCPPVSSPGITRSHRQNRPANQSTRGTRSPSRAAVTGATEERSELAGTQRVFPLAAKPPLGSESRPRSSRPGITR